MKSFWSKSNIRALTVLIPTVLILAMAIYLSKPNNELSMPEEVAKWQSRGEVDSVVLHKFDPNSADVFELLSLGLSRVQAVSIIKYREAGKVYRIKEDLLTVYAITDSMYRILEPYIDIDEEFRLKPRNFDRYAKDSSSRFVLAPFRMDTLRGEHLRAMLGFTSRQAEAFDRYRRRRDIRSIEELRECYLIGELADTLALYVTFVDTLPKDPFIEKIEINSADSATLVRIYGIGAKSAQAIVEYRERVGGFHSVWQIAEVNIVNEANFEKILQQIWCDSCKIQKIDINFAVPEKLRDNPYISARTLRRIIKQRQLKGGWCSIEEMIEDNILTSGEAKSLAPYLRFDIKQSE